ncbi:MAG: hypothetical protein A2152_01720 [Candidatus Levybacteria bacterium RBG_16_35_6]|nr:MAG: hypothetical protein A2152_01720 [Candidatus Levybacteria bacterium RBG_16_35_6]
MANYRFYLSKEILNLFKKGVLNIHPSLLPKYRGATPGQSAILNGDKKTGVSIIKLDEKMDHGPILWQKEEEIKEDDTAKSLYLKLFQLAANSIIEVINEYLNGDLKPIQQEDKKATYIKTLKRDSGYFDLNNPPKKDVLEKMIRAYYEWPGVWTKVKVEKKDLRIKFLPDNLLQVEGKKPIRLKDFENGYPMLYNEIRKII